MADATVNLQANAGNVSKTLGDLRKRLREVKNEANATSLSNVSALKRLREEYNRLDFQIKALSKGRGMFDGLDGVVNRAALRFASFSAIMSGLNRLFNAAIENNRELKNRISKVETAADGASRAFGDYLVNVDKSAGVTESFIGSLNRMTNFLEDFSTGKIGGGKDIGSIFTSFLQTEQHDRGRGLIARRRKRQREDALAGAQNEVTQAKARGKALDDLIKKQEQEIERVKEESEAVQDLLDAREALRKSVEEIGDTGDIGTSDVTRDKERNKIDQENIKARIELWDQESDKRMQIDEDDERRREQGFIRSANLYGNLLEQAILNGGDAFEKTFKAALAKIAIGATFGLIGQALGFGTFGKIFGGLTGLFAGGGEFYTRGPQLIMVGDNPGGVERVTVEPVSGKGKTRVLNNGAIAMAGGGSVSTVPTRSSTFVTRELVSLQIDSQDVDFAIRKNGKRRNDRRQGV